jgi:DNA/RNA endonuclease YhcR with UshA esterase domain
MVILGNCMAGVPRRSDRTVSILESEGAFMKKFLVGLMACVVVTSIHAWPQSSSATTKADTPSLPPKVTIEGLVRDIACPVQNLEATATHYNKKCLLACARKGSPLIILTKDGDLYLPMSDQMPDADEQQKLMPFLGKYVQVTGTVYERKGTHAIAISEIKELKDVHLTIDED